MCVCEGREVDVAFVLSALTDASALLSSFGGAQPPAICHCLILSRTGEVSRSVRSNCFSGGNLEAGETSRTGIGPAKGPKSVVESQIIVCACVWAKVNRPIEGRDRPQSRKNRIGTTPESSDGR